MRLSKIKLSGFKSFVDPTTLSFPSNLMGVVGPNGCGKSNIIDAIRWVLGESSAKTLRGDSMADVIFNGSSGRKPVGQASIELVFDNSDGTITGTYAGYSEVAMRRVVTRDGTSQYFLNNARCRRKDITNLLLGTGVGSHGYSIIEQGMISRLVEAKPEELRAFLEEAAGISKYKERRRETEHRIRHTRDNMDRLQDLRDELDNQLSHLQRQARAAERYKVLKAEERRTEAELLLLRLNTLGQELNGQQRTLAAKQLEQDAAVTRAGEIDARIERLRLELAEHNDAFGKVQGVYYRVGADIARLEQSMQHRNADIQRQQAELEQAEGQLQKVSGHISDDEVELEKLEQLLGRLNPELEEAQDQLESSEQALRTAERQAEASRDQAETLAAAMAAAERATEVEQARIEHLRERLERIAAERAEKAGELEAIDTAELEREVDRLTATEEGKGRELADAERELDALSGEIRRLRQQDSDLAGKLDGLREHLQRDKGRLSSLEALQEAAVGRISEAASRWLEQEDRARAPRLAARLQVAAGWDRAVEAVLSGYLNAIEARSLDSLAPHLEHLSQSGLAILETEQRASIETAADFGLESPESLRRPESPESSARSERSERSESSESPESAESSVSLASLASKVIAPESAPALLAGVYAAPSIEIALRHRVRLGTGESIVTPEGVLVTRHALRTHSSDDPQLGVIARGEEIEQLQASVRQLAESSESTGQSLVRIRNRLDQLEAQRIDSQTRVQELQGVHAEARAQLRAFRTRREELRERIAAIETDTVALTDEHHSIAQAVREAQNRLETAAAERASCAEAQASLQADRGGHIEQLRQAREQAEHDRERVKEIAIMVESRRSSQQSASAALERVQAQRRYLADRRTELIRRIEALEQPLADERATLEQQLDERLRVEESLAAARTAVEACEQAVREAESERSAAQEAVNAARDEVGSARLGVREIEVRAETVREQFAATGFDESTLAAELPAEANAADWSEKLETLGRKIQRLGPTNMAAIDEFEEKSERKTYLDKQFEDLTESLSTLEAAIRKIDSETRSRFRDTFNRANEGLGELFPRLFGGGQAYLELESDDLLSAGVTVMARPPGKRISTIHLMSGGEKALTAVALVFAIFKLNPAPFCLLDEVDAPLDDANVGRFSDIVREMSDRVQFVLITHNKTTMEAMNQLAGVTMHEPGVSRLVAVDIDEAVQLAAM